MIAFHEALHEAGDIVQLLRVDFASAQVIIGLDANVEIAHGLDDSSSFDSLGTVGPHVHPSISARSLRAIAFLAWRLEYQLFVSNVFPSSLGRDPACWTRRPWNVLARSTQIDFALVSVGLACTAAPSYELMGVSGHVPLISGAILPPHSVPRPVKLFRQSPGWRPANAKASCKYRACR